MKKLSLNIVLSTLLLTSFSLRADYAAALKKVVVAAAVGGVALGGTLVAVSWSLNNKNDLDSEKTANINISEDFYGKLENELKNSGFSIMDLEIVTAQGGTIDDMSESLGNGPLVQKFFIELNEALLR